MLSTKEKRDLIEEIKRELYLPKKVYVETCNEDIVLPDYAHIGDAGMDIRASEEIIIAPGETKLIKTGLIMGIPEGYEIQVRPRSGLSLKTPLRIANTPGTIDCGYRDEIGVIVSNSSKTIYKGSKEIDYETYGIDEKGNKPGNYIIKKNDRIAQIVLCKYEKIEFELVESGKIKSLNNNRGGGFGSSGIK